MKKTYAILGAGNGGQAIAGYISSLGYRVRLYDPMTEVVNKLNERGSIKLTGIYDSENKIELVSTDLKKVVKGADIVMVVNPSIYHRDMAINCAPFIEENQFIFLHPGGTFGAFAFKKGLEDGGCKFDVPIAESNTLIYACRAVEAGIVNVAGKKDRLLVATFPAANNEMVCNSLKEIYEEIEPASNVLVTSFDNTNPIFHPAPTLLSTSWVESDKDFLYYYEGISNSIGQFIIEMDKERIEVGKALGLEYGTDLISSFDQYELEYNCKGDNIMEVVRNVGAYEGIKGPNSLKTRYLYEDIPMGLVAIASLGDALGINVERIKLIISLGEKLLNEDFYTNSRNLKNLGLENMSSEEIFNFAITGQK
ncbi:NAD/NADP-dependent octopine/nopaline dehydrogenase family protein [Anaeromicrobium sediminis]|uniref:NAD/NADP octopine/nopaline dehydrogenase n=1 Tax=Anaeromicrobium sediminis TaxID=1478221 RepID=A0A267MC74_9FIRM|nr:NAD/NADP octopine/nopaline dehydrogenase family protein [Anaeromicrobium sediminis]PAB57146.1 hypothetical protein CCE28_19645 [Anaeromicrobium sediminis]